MTVARFGSVAAMGLAVSLFAGPALGDGEEQVWQDHASPFDFLFGNHIDTHLETKLGADGELSGRFFIIFTGEIDPVSGLPIARHPRGVGHTEDCAADVDCVVGWKLHTKPGKAKFLFHSGVNGNDHPVWAVNRVDIPQSGSFTHFHWIGADSTDPRAATGEVPPVCPGWFLEIKAVKSFAFRHGGEVVPVRPRIDNATHLNLLTNYAVVPGITPTSGGGGTHDHE